MKRLFLIFVVVAVSVAMTGCDPYCSYDFYLKNGTDADLIVEVEPLLKPTIINPNGKERIDNLGSYTTNAVDRFSPEEFMSSFQEIKINEVVMPKSIWQRKYWEYTSESKSHAHYTLTVTEEFLESLLQKEIQ